MSWWRHIVLFQLELGTPHYLYFKTYCVAIVNGLIPFSQTEHVLREPHCYCSKIAKRSLTDLCLFSSSSNEACLKRQNDKPDTEMLFYTWFQLRCPQNVNKTFGRAMRTALLHPKFCLPLMKISVGKEYSPKFLSLRIFSLPCSLLLCLFQIFSFFPTTCLFADALLLKTRFFQDLGFRLGSVSVASSWYYFTFISGCLPLRCIIMKLVSY
jgi:hypothetical protein